MSRYIKLIRESSAFENLNTLDTKELRQLALSLGADSGIGFNSFKKALIALGVDYDALRSEKIAQAAAEKVVPKKALILYSDAKASANKFAIVDVDGQPVWHGQFFSEDNDFNGEQSTGEMSAAKKAVWIASKLIAQVNEPVKLILRVDAQWLVYANCVANQSHRGGKARDLGYAAKRLDVDMIVEHIPGSQNPADRYTLRGTGFMKHQDYIFNLTSLVTYEEA